MSVCEVPSLTWRIVYILSLTSPFIHLSFLLVIVYPVVVHWVWSENGYLSNYSEKPLWGVGMIDQAGSGVVHVTGGVTALIASRVLGPRTGRFYDAHTGEKLEETNPMPGHSTSLQASV